MQNGKKKRIKRIVLITGIVLIVSFGALLFSINRFVEPMLRDRLHTLIVQGSDSLYRYELGNLNANFFGGNVAVENLHIRVDSARFQKMMAENALPSLTFQMDLQKGQIKGLGVFSLLFGKQIKISEILSREADVTLSRHVREKGDTATKQTTPLWKLMQPMVKSIQIDRINLDGIKLLYRNADTLASVKLQFDRCNALFEDIRVDSAATVDTARIAFVKNISLHFSDLKFRTPDSTYKMKAEEIYYSSKQRRLEIDDFQIKPTLDEKDVFYASPLRQQSMYQINLEKAVFTNLRLDQFINKNVITADSVLLHKPVVQIYTDRVAYNEYKNKFGTYPHQKLLQAGPVVRINTIRINDADVNYTERSDKTRQEGTLTFTGMNAVLQNITNDEQLIQKNAVCTAKVEGTFLRQSPIKAQFSFYLDSTEGEFSATGEVRNLTAAQLNPVALPLANTQVPSGTIHELNFSVQGDDFRGIGKVDMRYNNLHIVLRKQDEETGQIKTLKFLNKLLNKFTLWHDNPGPDGQLRSGKEVIYARVSSKSFFGMLWKTIFQGMQDVMLKSGRYQ